jgi:xylulokinase
MAYYILAHDLGTTGNKAVLFDEKGEIIGSVYHPYDTYYPRPGFVEQRPDDWWKAVCLTVRQLLESTKVRPDLIACVTFSGQMMSAVPVDEGGNLLRESILIWADTRSRKPAEGMVERLGGWESFFEMTGAGLLPENYTLSKILWHKENEPDIYQKTYKFLHAKDYIICRLTGRFTNDYTDASNSGYLDIRRRDYSEEILEAAGVSKDKLPELHESTDVVGHITEGAAKESGLTAGTPVVEGAGDVPAATLGAGVARKGVGYIYIGSANWTGAYAKEPILDAKTRVVNLCHVIPGVYAPHHTAYVGGIAQQWFRDNFCEVEKSAAETLGLNAYSLMNLKLEGVPPGADNVIFLPYMREGGAPYHNPHARGAFIGLTLPTKKEHLLRALLEGVAFNFRILTENFANVGVQTKEFRAIGGGVLNRIWMQIYADVLRTRVVCPVLSQEANAFGAAVAGGIGVKMFQGFDAAESLSPATYACQPKAEASEKYEQLYPVFKKAYECLIPVFGQLASAR